jgi:regulator of replication initiation timing
MQRQHTHLIEEECRLLQEELTRYRQNTAKLVDMHAELTVERNALRTKLAEANTRVSDCLREAAEDWKRINSLQTVAEQVEHLRAEREELLNQIAALTTEAKP